MISREDIPIWMLDVLNDMDQKELEAFTEEVKRKARYKEYLTLKKEFGEHKDNVVGLPTPKEKEKKDE